MMVRDTRSHIDLIKGLISPVAASAVIVLVLVSMIEPKESESSGVHFLEIEKAFQVFPEEIRSEDGIWLQRRVVPVPTGQAELLGKSVFMSREFIRLRAFPRVTAILFLVYCAESRMMAGHHPPNCYPSSGWNMLDDQTTSFSIDRSDGRKIDATIYRFDRPNNQGEALAIVSGFFLGNGRFFSTLQAANENSRPSLLGGSGLFQFQILLQGGLSAADVERYGRELLSGIPHEFFDAIRSEGNSSEMVSNPGGVL